MTSMVTPGLSVAEPVDSAHGERIRTVLAAPPWQWLTQDIRAAWELDLSRRRVRIDVNSLGEPQVAAIADFLSWPIHRSGVVTFDLARLDTLLRRSGLAAGLATCLYESGGPLADAGGARRDAVATRRATAEQVWVDAAKRVASLEQPRLLEWLAQERGAGRLPADPQLRSKALFGSVDVLSQLPHAGIGLAQLATQVLGAAHALDSGPTVATVLRALAWLRGQPEVPAGAAGRRALWADFGVALDTVSSTVLLLGLRLVGSGPIATTLEVNRAEGIPVRLTLRQVQHHLRGSVGGPPVVWVCENPSVVEEAADKLGARCAPLICVEGRPSVAATLLLGALRHSGTELRYHGDFDWAGLSIAASVIELGAIPWRMSVTDYLSALQRIRVQLPVLAPASLRTTAGGASAWDPILTIEMRTHGVQIEEEHVVDDLLADLDAASIGIEGGG
jgi:uncharacterized protein (TIGR02679 family)